MSDRQKILDDETTFRIAFDLRQSAKHMIATVAEDVSRWAKAIPKEFLAIVGDGIFVVTDEELLAARQSVIDARKAAEECDPSPIAGNAATYLAWRMNLAVALEKRRLAIAYQQSALAYMDLLYEKIEKHYGECLLGAEI